jgi:hypothetical protein
MPIAARIAPKTITIGVETLNPARPNRLISIAIHSSVERRLAMSHGLTHGAHIAIETIAIWIHIRKRNSIALAFINNSLVPECSIRLERDT